VRRSDGNQAIRASAALRWSKFYRLASLFQAIGSPDPCPALFADENKDAGGQRHNINEENAWPELQTEPEKAMEDQIKREQKHADVLGKFHYVDPADRLLS
jgi:hypothetical protein